jgi:hypothetical protein
MKQKIDNNTPVTKIELTEILKDYPTKTDLDERFVKFQNAFHTKIDHKFIMMMGKFDEKFSKFANLMLTAIDPLIKDLETRREDREIATAQMREVKERLTKLEHS